MLKYLNYPLDSKLILRKKKSLKRELLSRNKFLNLNVAILGGSTTNEIEDILEIFLLNKGVKPKFYQSDYNKFYEDSVFENENLKLFNPDIIYIHTSNVNIINFPKINNSITEINNLLENEFDRFKNVWNGLQKYNCDIIQNNFELTSERILGNLDFSDIHGKTNFINKLNIKFANYISNKSNIHINDINYLSSKVGLDNWFDESLWFRAKYSLSFTQIPLLCNNLAAIINAILGRTKKCLVLDLDNTCWGGVIGDDGLNGIKLGRETPVGEAYLNFQNYIVKLKERGIILAVSSKNNDKIAKEGFSHSDSILSLNDFTSFKANWEPKYLNIIQISKDVNIGLDSLVFIDDNPTERNFVSSQISQVSVPEIGNNILDFIKHIEENKYFEITNLSNDDIKRSKYYSDNNKRILEQFEFKDYNDFLKSLEMNAEVKMFVPDYLERITQLINKTNQFNLTTKRYTNSEVKTFMTDNKHISVYGKLSDKFGDNGIISVLISKLSENYCTIDTWIMSCRVFKREMEYEMFNEFIRICKTNKIKKVFGIYSPTKKNKIVANHYSKLGFSMTDETKEGNTTWELLIKNYKTIKTSIKIN